MQYRLLGGTGIHVSAFTLGAMSFGALGNTDHDDCVRIVRRALDAGINTVDTADVYSQGESEEICAEALAGVRDDVDQMLLADGYRSQPQRSVASMDREGV